MAVPPPQALALKSTAGGGALYQLTPLAWSSLNVGDVLTLTVAAGKRNNPALTWSDQAFFGLTDGAPGTLPTAPNLSATVANSGYLTTSNGLLTDGSMIDFTVTYTVQTADLSRTGTVGILLSGTSSVPGNATQAFFDHVRLDRSSHNTVPPPNLVFLFLDDMRWEAEDAFQPLPEEAFAGYRFGDFACGSQVAAPGEAEDEGQGDQGEQGPYTRERSFSR